MRVGLVSDTHGLADPKLASLFAGCDLILHAGDVEGAAVLEALHRIAPVRAVRGNADELGPLSHLPETARVPLGEIVALVVHALGPPGDPSPAARRALARARPQVVIHGHSHRPGAELRDGVLYVNPGSAGPRRFRLPRAAGLLTVDGRRARAEIRDLAHLGLPLLGEPVDALL